MPGDGQQWRDGNAVVGETRVLTPAEGRVILEDWNNTSAAYPRDVPLAHLVEAQAGRTPNAVASVCGDVSLTYGELNAQANQLARELRRHGVGPNELVGICVDRSVDMMVALLAVTKTGAGYVPLDPYFPRERLAYIMHDSQLRAVVASTQTFPSIAAHDGAVVLLDAADWRANSRDNLPVAAAPESVAYVMYTSGSTGTPKGVEVSYGALVNLLWTMRARFGLGAKDRLLAMTTISFDIAGVDIWLPWLLGAQTVISNRQATAAQLLDLIERHDVTFLQTTPANWRMLLEAGWKGKKNMQVVSTGEALPADLAAALRPGVARLWNLYGPTETTIWSTGYVVRGDERSIPIGKPLANTRCYVLDAELRLVPAGVTGELYIGGHGLANGYLNRPDLTAERFVPDPFSAEVGARMYRTGDLARFQPDGNIECLGRTDDQVKIRGIRIELGEIETVLKGHRQVRQALVVARNTAAGEKSLVAYVVATNGEQVSAATLRDYLKESLPEYMVPSQFIALDALPMNASGKIDRRALPDYDPHASAGARPIVEPRTRTERQLADIWRELFNLPGLSVDDDFFDLGGHSLMAVRLMARIDKVFRKQLSLNALFESPTIARLARQIDDHRASSGRHTIVPLQASGSRLPVFWVPGGAGVTALSLRHMVAALGDDQPAFGLCSTLPQTLGDVPSVAERARGYVALIRTIQPRGPYRLAGFCAGGPVAFEMAQQLAADGEKIGFLGIVNSGVPNYPDRHADRLWFRAQRLWHQILVAIADGLGLSGYTLTKLAARRAAAIARQQVAIARERVKQYGFDRYDLTHDRVLVDATDDVIRQYKPLPYAGAVALFLCDDEDLAGVSEHLDPRLQWAQYAATYEIHRFPGGHDAAIEMPTCVPFAQVFRAALDRTVSGHLVQRPSHYA